VIVRDTLVGGIRSVAAADQVVIAAKPTGKWKTALQMAAIPAVMLGNQFDLPLVSIGYDILWFTVILSVISGVQYFAAFARGRKQK